MRNCFNIFSISISQNENIFPNIDVLQYLDLVALATICDLVPLSEIIEVLLNRD